MSDAALPWCKEAGNAYDRLGWTVAGDLIVMGGRCQRDWRHCVPKQATPSGPRISVNFAASSQFRPD